MNDLLKERIEGYLNGVADLNTTFYRVNCSYSFSFTSYTYENDLNVCINEYFHNNQNHKSTLIKIDNWEEKLKKSCVRWFYDGFHVMMIDKLAEETSEAEFSRVRGVFNDVIREDNTSIKSFISLIKEFFDGNSFIVYELKSNPGFFYECEWEDYVIVSGKTAYFLHFGVSD